MKTSLTRIAIATVALGLFSSGAFAHEEYSETGPYHWLQHVADAKTSASQYQAGAADSSTAQRARRGDFGVPSKGAPLRTIKIDATTKYINADHMQTVRIVNDRGQSFLWQFDTFPATVNFPLKAIVPSGFEAGDTQIYIDHPGEHLG